MKLLIVTQAVDQNHPILNFFIRWIEEFAFHYEKVTVICLEKGEYSLPENVEVISLEKESGSNRWRRTQIFYRYIWQKRNNYDSVFVHMNQVYVLMGGLLWRLLGKRIGLWYTHGTVSWSLRMAAIITNNIYSASDESCKLQTTKKIVTGHGIDTRVFESISIEKDIDLVTVGRITLAKNLETLLEIFCEIRKKHDVKLTVVGITLTQDDGEYLISLKKMIKAQDLEKYVIFYGPVKNTELPKILNRSKIFVTTATNGSLDKVMLEAMSCGLPIISTAPGSKSLPLGVDQVNESSFFVDRVNSLLENKNQEIRYDYVDYVSQNHSLFKLITKISDILSQEI